MSPPRITLQEIAISSIPAVVMLVALAGLIVRGRWRLSLAFSAYLASAIVLVTLMTGWPDRFYNGAVWMIQQAILAILKLAIVLEVAWRTFRVFPGARSAARNALLLVIAPTALAVATVPMSMNGWNAYETLLGQAHPFVLGGTIWMICVVLTAAHVYRVPVHPFHVAMMTSFALYLFCSASILRLEVLHGFDEFRTYGNAVDGAAWLLVTCWWAYVAWRGETEGARAYVDTVARLQRRTPPAGAGLPSPTALIGTLP